MRRWTVVVAAFVACLTVYVPAPARASARKEQGHRRCRRQDALLLPAAHDRRAARATSRRKDSTSRSRTSPAARARCRRCSAAASTSCPAPTSTRSRSRRKGRTSRRWSCRGNTRRWCSVMSKAKAEKYKSPADLKGMKIGVTAPGSSTNMFVNILLAKVGLKPDDVSIIGVGATAGAVAIMQRGEIDALVNLDPVIAQLESQGFVVRSIDTRTAKGMQDVYGGAYAGGSIYVPVDFVKKYPNTAQAFVNAMMRALRFIQTSTPDQIIAAVPPEYYADKALYKAALEKNLESYKHDGTDSAWKPRATCIAISSRSIPACRTRRWILRRRTIRRSRRKQRRSTSDSRLGAQSGACTRARPHHLHVRRAAGCKGWQHRTLHCGAGRFARGSRRRIRLGGRAQRAAANRRC